MNRGAKIAVATVATAMLAAGGFGAYNIAHGLLGGSSSAAPTFDPAALSTTPPSDGTSQKLAAAFLQSWQSGPEHYAGAASDTDSPRTAQSALQDYHDGLGLTGVTFANVRAAGPSTRSSGATLVNYDVTAQVKGGTWTYQGSLEVEQSTNGQAAVRWAPSVLYPKLTTGQTLQAGAIPADARTVKVVDDKGKPLTPAQFPSLGDILGQLRTKGPGQAGGGSGSGVAIVDASGSPVGAAATFRAPAAATIKTTLDSGLQAAAERAVQDSKIKGMPAGVVAIDHHTGEIRAIAYSGGTDLAINGWSAPGSTMKIITAATLIDQAGMTPSTPASCPPTVTVSGQVIPNVDNEQAAGADMRTAFAMSCNTAFIKLLDNAWGASHHFDALSTEAANVFGIGSWHIGVATHDPQIQAAGNRQFLAGDAIGQGDIAVSPLVMASVGATVAHGGFLQPILVPGLPQTPAAQPMSRQTARYLRQMMETTARSGTAAPRTSGMSGVGAKTGTAEVPGGTNGWFVAYDGSISVAAEVVGGKRGVDSAGYVVADLLHADH